MSERLASAMAAPGAESAASEFAGAICEVLLARHGETGPELRGRFVGASDVALGEAGRAQAAALGRRLRGERFDRFLVSPMARTRQTAEPLAAEGRALEIMEDLREVDFGAWERLSFEEIARRDPEAVARWSAFDPEFGFPGGESLAGFAARVRRAAEAIETMQAGRVLVVSHGGVIRALLCHWLGLSPRDYLLFEVQPASLTTVRLFGARGVLTGLNDRSHLTERV